MPLPTPDECREKAHEELIEAQSSPSPHWVSSRSQRAMAWLALADSLLLAESLSTDDATPGEEDTE